MIGAKFSQIAAKWAIGVLVFAIPLVSSLTSPAQAEKNVIHAYGPGGPAPAMKELAAKFESRTGNKVVVTAGPPPKWMKKAKTDADIIFSGSENMMTGFERAFAGKIDAKTIEPLYIRPSTILVRKGNPKNIKGFRDLARPGTKIMVVGGAGQVGLWEDVATRTGDITLLAAIRRNIVVNAVNSGKALKAWTGDASIDAWLIWTHWQVAHKDLADQVAVEKDLRVWRPMDIALTVDGASKRAAKAFIAFIKSPVGVAVFEKWGWSSGR